MRIRSSPIGDIIQVVLVLAASNKILVKEGLLCSRTLF